LATYILLKQFVGEREITTLDIAPAEKILVAQIGGTKVLTKLNKSRDHSPVTIIIYTSPFLQKVK
jgi:hypothetical protein